MPKPISVTASNLRAFTRAERLFALIFGHCNHSWGFPITLGNFRYPRPYDSHIACTKCAEARLFNSYTWEAGPFFKKVQ
jgi:hypothetical protein